MTLIFRGWFSTLAMMAILFGGFSESKAQSPIEYQSIRHNGIGFRVPASMTLEPIAAPPLVHWPIVGDWDDHHRLVLVESAGVNKNVVEQSQTKPHRMIRLVDDNGDGVFDRRILAAEQLGFPEGVLCLGPDTFVSTPPQIMKLTDRDGDGICEERSVWFDGQTLTGCANDLHGPYLGRDGWIYWCKGAFAEQKHATLSGTELVSKAAHIFRRHRDGGPIEAVMTGGMDNPVEFAMTPEGERFFTSTFLQHPGGGKRDGIAHAVYGGVYGKDHHVIQGHIRTGPLMPIMTHLGPAAPSGLACWNDGSLFSDFMVQRERALVAAEFNLQRVSLHALQPRGATFETRDIDLVLGDRIDFHPTDILEDFDGSMIIVDTGGWYDLCCPSSGVDQDKALGGIYRLSNKQTQLHQESIAKAATSQPIDLRKLRGPLSGSWWERKHAAIAWENQPEGMEALLAQITNSQLALDLRIEALWCYSRALTLHRDAQKDAQLIRILSATLQDAEPSLRQVSAHLVSLHRLPMHLALERIVESDGVLQVRRAAAEGLGRLGQVSSLKSLMHCLEDSDEDLVLRHSLLYAMIELRQEEALAQYIDAKSPTQQSAAMLALDQMKSQRLQPKQVLRSLLSSNSNLRIAALDVASHHPEWAETLANDLQELSRANGDSEQGRVWLSLVSAWKERPEVRSLVTAQLSSAKQASPEKQKHILESLRQLRDKELNAEWSPSIAEWLSQSSPELEQGILGWLATLQWNAERHPQLAEKLLSHVNQSTHITLETFLWTQALPDQSKGISEAVLLRWIAALVDGDESARSWASKAILKTQLTSQSAQRLIEGLATVAPLHLPSAITAISRVGDDELDQSLLKRLESHRSIQSIPPETLTTVYRNRDKRLQDSAKKLIEFLQKPPVDVVEKLNQMESQLPPGDPVRGFQVFRDQKTACSACHRIGYVGGNIGPELSRIGSTRTRRDLLEAILFPSLRLAQSYQATQVVTTDGEVLNGIVQSESRNELELVINADRIVRIPIQEIEKRQPSTVSIMPAGLEKTISLQELADLISMLESKK